MERLVIFLSIVVVVFGLLFAVAFVAQFLRSAKTKRTTEQMLAITNVLIPFIEKAEKFAGYSGCEKKEYVMTRANQFAIDNGIYFDEELVSARIENLVALSKRVNNRECPTVSSHDASATDALTY